MRPNVDIGWEDHGAIKAIADARYGGDLDDAYTEVLKRGLKYSAIPGSERIEAGDAANIRFIPTEGEGNPFVFHRHLGRSTNLYSVGQGPYKTFEIDEIRERLATISRYENVGIENAAFGLRRSGGNWVGWGFGNFVEALSRPVDRYRDIDFDELSREEAGIVFNVGSDSVILRGRHLPEHNVLGNVHLKMLTEGWPMRLDSSSEAVLGEFGARVMNPTEFPERAHIGPVHETISVRPIGYLTHMEREREWVHGFMIENPFKSKELHHDDPTIGFPEYVALYLTDHKLRDEAPSSEYQIEEYGVNFGSVTNITLLGSWSQSV